MAFDVRLPILSKLFVDNGKRQAFAKGEVVISTDDVHNLWLIEKGYVKRYQINNNGSINIQSIYGPGEVFSLTHVFRLLKHKNIYKGPETFFYETLSPSVLYKLNEKILAKTCQSKPEIYEELFAVAGDRFLSNIQQLENLGLQDAYRRVAHTILFYAKRGKLNKKGQLVITIPFTQQDMADLLSLTRETVSACAARLKKEGYVDVKRRQIIIPNIKRLARLAYS